MANASSLSSGPDRSLTVGLICFRGLKSAAHARRPLEARLHSAGRVLDSTVLQVNQKQQTLVYDPRRVRLGALTSALTWGIFGLVTGGIPSLIISAVSGALFGGWAARSHAHHLSQKELERLGTQLPADSSALLTYVQGENADAVLNAARSQTPGAASAAVIDNQLQAQVMSDTGEAPNAVADQPATDELTPRLSMLLFRYDDPKAAQRVAAALTTRGGAEPGAPEVELIVQLDNAGHRHVKAPTFGVGAVATYDVRAWGGFGLVMGALAGFTGGYGFIGFLGGGIVTGVAWGLFGLAAGALYGLWVGKTVSARRVKGIAPLVTPGTSFLLGWGETPLSERHRQVLMDNSEPRRLILSFRPIGHGATLERIPT